MLGAVCPYRKSLFWVESEDAEEIYFQMCTREVAGFPRKRNKRNIEQIYGLDL